MAGTSGTQYVSLTKAWPQVEERRGLVALMKREGFAGDEIAKWLTLTGYPDAKKLVTIAQRWRLHGFDAESAVEWERLTGWEPEEALKWVSADFSARQAEFAQWLIISALLEQDGDFDEIAGRELAWLSSGLPASWICLCLAAGHWEVQQARDLEVQCLAKPSVRGELRLRAQLRGWDVRGLGVEGPQR